MYVLILLFFANFPLKAMFSLKESIQMISKKKQIVSLPIYNFFRDLNHVAFQKNLPNNHTQLLYFSDTYCYSGASKIIDKGIDFKRGEYLVFDKTIFYPQGGGQPSDIGDIFINNRQYTVNFVSLLNNFVHHYITESTISVSLEDQVYMKINSDNRIRNAKAHTAGHLLACVIESIAPEFTASKGYHFSNGPYIEFEGKLSSLTLEKLKKNTEEKISFFIKDKTPIILKETNENNLDTLIMSENLKTFEDKRSRLIQIKGFEPVPCGGTHISNLSELQSVTIRKIQLSENKLRIGYNFL